MMHARRSQAGVTLLEIMIVLALMALIATAVGGWLIERFKSGQVEAVKLQIRNLSGSVQQYVINKSRCPTMDDLIAQRFVRSAPKDPWGNAVIVRCPGQHDPDGVDILSFGPDGQEGTEDDVKSWGQ